MDGLSAMQIEGLEVYRLLIVPTAKQGDEFPAVFSILPPDFGPGFLILQFPLVQ
jgi:hypothetical protein